MASLGNAFPDKIEGDGAGFPGKSGITFYADDLTAIYTAEAAANNGKADKYAAAIQTMLMGNASSKLLGVANPTVKVAGEGAYMIRSVTGVVSAADVGKPVFATDENTYTLTPPTLQQQAVGVVVKWLTGTTAILWQFSQEALRLSELNALGLRAVELGPIDAISLANGNMLVDFPMDFHGQIDYLEARCLKVPTGGGATAILKAQILPAGGAYADVGAPTTVTVALANTLGQVIRSAKVPLVLTGAGLNVFHDGDKLQLVAGTVTAFTAGLYGFRAICRTRPGL